ncbi:UvrD-helicase domain-containing protein [Vulgatibacter incomptus]|uniref:DNA 3'-5' helicase n=1 Tax=Vulgatibacter incomptus TaxID=1391653 RepID=A0A0K1P8E5_9BACT|nr:UvrD-helicase domain-containing protein [Vulgatibacter incomptus]AKU89701.1 Exodeoxyribonuclease V beta chain [Vulgatibacter incomptus]
MSALRYEKPAILGRLPKDRHAVIEASAGTGKTYTIEHLVVELVVEAGVPIAEILVVTFTEKATSELRARVRKLLVDLLALTPDKSAAATVPDERCWILDDEKRAKLERALRDFDSATISTIHSFCQRILTEHAFANQRLFSEQRVDGREAFSAAFQEALRTDLAVDPEHAALLAVWLESKTVPDLEKLLHACAGKRGRLLPIWDEPALDRAISAFPVASDFELLLKDEMKAAKGRSATAPMNRYAFLRDELRSYPSNGAFLEKVAALQSLRKPGREKWLGELRAVLDEIPPGGPAIDALREPVAALDDGIVSLEALVVQRFLPCVQARLAGRKQVQGLFDFDDMLSLVRDSLQGAHGEALVGLLRERYRYALIDEFQDTDELQWEIFRRIFFESGGKNFLFLIGDPKQAIYRFRGADVETYLAAKGELVAAGGAREALTENFRSTARLIEAYNRILDQQGDPPFFTRAGIGYEEPVRCGNQALELLGPDGEPAAPIHVFELPIRKGEMSKDVLLPVLGARLAREIRAITDPVAPSLRFSKGSGEPERIAPRDIYVLCSTKDDGERVGEELRKAGVPHAHYKQEGLLDTDAARALHDVLAAVAEPDDHAKRMRAWLSPFFGLRLRDLPSVRDLPPSDPLVQRLLDWKGEADGRRFERLFSRLLDESGIVRRLVLSDSGDRDLTNFLHLCELLLEALGSTCRTLPELVALLGRWIDGTAKPEQEDGNQQRLESDRDAVQIMTMHASKGLEAKVVFLVGGVGPRPASSTAAFHDRDGARVTWVGKPPKVVQTLVDREAEWEDQRLLYVALTRAKARLYLPAYPSDEDGAALKGAYRVLNPRLLAMRGESDPLFTVETLVGHDDTEDGSVSASVSLRDWEPAYGLLEEVDRTDELNALRAAHQGYRITSYTQLREGAPKGGHEPERDEFAGESERAAHPADDELPGGAGSGIFLHELLEKVSPRSVVEAGSPEEFLARTEVGEFFQREAARAGVDRRHLRHAGALVHGALAGRIRLRDGRILEGIAHAPRLLREAEFLYPIPERSHPRLTQALTGQHLEIRRGFVKGFVDVLFEHDGLAYFGDWKSDVLPSWSRAAIDERVEKSYRLQAQLYSLALVKMIGVRDEASYEARVGGFLYLFLRGMKPDGDGTEGVHFERPSWSHILEWERALLEREDLEVAT